MDGGPVGISFDCCFDRPAGSCVDKLAYLILDDLFTPSFRLGVPCAMLLYTFRIVSDSHASCDVACVKAVRPHLPHRKIPSVCAELFSPLGFRGAIAQMKQSEGTGACYD